MRGVMLDVPEHILTERRISGADQFDEMWEGVLHMVPPPSVENQNTEWLIEAWLRHYWKPLHPKNRVLHQVALSPDDNWRFNFRTPDIVLFTAQELPNLRRTFCHGPCTVAIEIRSPGDESFEKLDFYAALKVPEVWIVDAGSIDSPVFVLQGNSYERRAADVEGWITSPSTSIKLRPLKDQLSLQMLDDSATFQNVSHVFE
jgi:Uma2 family endonuclease